VDPSRVGQNTYATLGERPLSLNCLQTFKTRKQLDGEWEQRRQQQQEEARIRHEEAIKVSKHLPSVNLSKVPYKTWSAAARAFKSKYKNFDAELFIRAREEINVMLEENSAEDEKGNYSLIITVFFHDYDGLAWEIGVEVGDENTLEYCDLDATINRVPRSLPFASDRYAFERKAYQDFLDLLLNPAAAEPTAAKSPQSNPPGIPFSSFKNAPVGLSPSEPPPLPRADFSILTEGHEAPVKKAWWKFW
jgi:hypothetical protein